MRSSFQCPGEQGKLVLLHFISERSVQFGSNMTQAVALPSASPGEPALQPHVSEYQETFPDIQPKCSFP